MLDINNPKISSKALKELAEILDKYKIQLPKEDLEKCGLFMVNLLANAVKITE